MSKGYNLMFWGIFFKTFYINFGEVRLLPNFIADLIIYYGITVIAKDYDIKSVKQAGKICAFIIAASLIMEFVTIGNKNIFIEKPIFHILWASAYGIIEMIMIYKMLKGSSEILKLNNNDLDKKYDKKAIIYVVMISLTIVTTNISMIFMIEIIWTVIAVYNLLINVWIMISFRKLRLVK